MGATGPAVLRALEMAGAGGGESVAAAFQPMILVFGPG